MITSCSNCKETIEIFGTGQHICPYCKEKFNITEKEFEKLKADSVKFHSTDKKKIFPVYLLWVLSILGILFSLPVLSFSFFSGLLFLISSLLILPPIKNFYTKKVPIRLRYILIITTILFILGFSLYEHSDPEMSGGALPMQFKKETKRATPIQTESLVDKSVEYLAYYCVDVETIRVNGVELSKEDVEKVCRDNYSLVLQEGLNEFTVELVMPENTLTENLKVTYDKKAYLAKIEKEKTEAAIVAAKAEEQEIKLFANENDISLKLARNLLIVLEGVNVEKEDVDGLRRIDDWASGSRYKYMLDGQEYVIYVNTDETISAIRNLPSLDYIYRSPSK